VGDLEIVGDGRAATGDWSDVVEMNVVIRYVTTTDAAVVAVAGEHCTPYVCRDYPPVC
jgi:hypothetical protein